jgi:hypothetical protein
MIRHLGTTAKLYRVILRFIASIAVVAVLMTVAFRAQAQDEQATSKKETPKESAAAKNAPKRTTINFEDQLVEGQTQKPELFYILQQRNNNFKRLIRPRENFLPEMRKSSESVGRPGSGKGNDN